MPVFIRTPKPAVLPTTANLENFLPNQPKFSAASEKTISHLIAFHNDLTIHNG
jgi:hypothetical protein